MPRPKSNKPQKIHYTLSVSPETRALLNYIAAAEGCTVSDLITNYAAKEAQKVHRRTKLPLPGAESTQISFFDGGDGGADNG